MRLQSLELMPDEAGEQHVRRQWQRLRDAGLPSQLDHSSVSNAPHVTAVAVPALDPAAVDLAAKVLGPLLPVECRLTGLVLLGDRRLVLARLAEVPDALVEAVLRLRASTQGHPFPGWLPHVTLAHGVDPRDLARTTEVLDLAPAAFALTSVRHWDPGKAVTSLVCAISV